jgi:hypothetical protein
MGVEAKGAAPNMKKGKRVEVFLQKIVRERSLSQREW